MNTLQMLEREELPDIDPDQLVSRDILEYAENKLGYKQPAQSRKARQSSLTQAFRAMGHKPFMHQSVSKYMDAEVKRYKPGAFVQKFASVPESVIGFLAFVAVMSLVTTIVCLGVRLADKASVGLPLSVAQLISGTILCVCIGTFIIGLWADGRNGINVFWKGINIENYEGPIPEFALATAMEIHQRVPEAKFIIEELIVEHRTIDPFLKVILGDEFHYMEVWKEPGYKQERMA